MHFFVARLLSIAVIIKIYVRHVRNLYVWRTGWFITHRQQITISYANTCVKRTIPLSFQLVWRLFSREPGEYPHKPYIDRDYRLTCWTFALLSTSLLICTQLSPKATNWHAQRGVKTKFNTKWQFKVTCLGSVESRRGTSYRYIIMLVLSPKVPKIYPAKALKIAFPTLHCRLTPLLQGTPRISAAKSRVNLILPETRVGTLFLSLTVCVHLYSNFPRGLRKIFWNGVRNGRSRSSKVVDFSTNRNRVCDFLLVINSNPGPYCTVPEIGRLFVWKLRTFTTQPLITPSFGVNPFEFLDELLISRTRVLGLSVGGDCWLASFLTQYILAPDRRTQHDDG